MKAAVVGGGLGGCATALALRAVGLDVSVFEAADGPRRGGHSLSLFPSGTAALAVLGARELPGVVIERVTQIQQASGRTISSFAMAPLMDRVGGYPYVVCPRQDLAELLEAMVGGINYAKRATAVTPGATGAVVAFADGEETSVDLVVGADGSASVIRDSLWAGPPRRFLSVVWQASVALPGDYPSPTEALVVRGPLSFAGTFPTSGGRVNLFFEATADSPDAAEAPWGELTKRFRQLPAPLRQWFLDTPGGAFETYPIFVRPPARRWNSGPVVLLGDAAHSLSPSGGQGSKEAFVDAVALGRAIAGNTSLDAALDAYTRSRARRSLRAYRQSTYSMRPIMSRLLATRITPPGPLATRAAAALVGPDALVRRALDTGIAG